MNVSEVMIELRSLLLTWQATPIPTMSDEASFTAWTTAIGVLIAAISGAVASYLTLKYTKGKDYQVAIMREQQKLNQQEIEKNKLDVNELARAYESVLKKAEEDTRAAIASMQSHLDLLDRKLDACESQHLACIAKAAKLEGKLEALESSHTEVCEKVERMRGKAADSGLNLG